MTFIAQEESVESGSPQELYEFSYESTTWRYTSGDAPYTSGGHTYDPIALRRSNLEFTGDFSKGAVELTIPISTPFLDLFLASMPSGVVSLTVKRVHRTDTSNEIIVMWKGRILNVTWAPPEVTLICEPIRSSVKRFGLRRLFQISCPHVLYSTACGVVKSSYELSGPVTAVSGTTIAVDGVDTFDADYFAGGYAEYTNSILNTTERRMITSHPGSSDNVVLVSPPMNLALGSTVKLYPGCDHSIGTCDTKFDNSPNYGGFPYTPTKNPFSGELIY